MTTDQPEEPGGRWPRDSDQEAARSIERESLTASRVG